MTRKSGNLRKNAALAAGLVAAVAAALAVPAGAWAADEPAGPQELKFVWGPMLQNLTPTGVNVLWGASGAIGGTVEYGTSADKLDKSVKLPAEAPGRATIEGLEPGKTYYYRVKVSPPGGGQAVSTEVYPFTTPTADVTKFSFVFFSDTHTAGCNKDLAVLMAEQRPDFVVNGGDRHPSVLSGTLKPYADVLARIPTYMIRGNHDNEDRQNMVSMMPGPGNNQYFAFTWGNARLICLNTGRKGGKEVGLNKGGEQYQWLEHELKNCKQTWKIVFQHIPVYSGYKGNPMDAQADEAELLEQYGVDFVLNGHDHHYCRTPAIRGGKAAEDGKGVTYITAGGACGSPDEFKKGEDLWFIKKAFHGEPFLGICHVEGNKLTLEFLTPDKKVIDTVEFTKP